MIEPGKIDTAGPALRDPLADLPEPPIGGIDLGTIATPGTYPPGYYSGGIDLDGPGTAVLQPGVFVLEGAGLHVRGTASVTGTGCLLFVRQGAVDIALTTTVSVTAPESGPYNGLVLFQGRENAADARIAAGPYVDLEGTLYLPAALFIVRGIGDVGRQWIAWRIRVQGAGSLVLHHDGRFPPPDPRIILVE